MIIFLTTRAREKMQKYRVFFHFANKQICKFL